MKRKPRRYERDGRNISFRPSNRQPKSAAGPEILLSRHSDADSFLRRDEVIDALSILGNGELNALDDPLNSFPRAP